MASRVKPGWIKDHAIFEKQLLKSRCDVIIFGDSIVKGLSRYKSVVRTFGNFLNVGFGGDNVENVYWRIKNTRFNKNIRYLFIHCGTNNLDSCSPTKIQDGLLDIYFYLRRNYPQIDVFVSGILPRVGHFFSSRVKDTNERLRQMCSNINVTFIEHSAWVDEFGNIREELFWKDGI